MPQGYIGQITDRQNLSIKFIKCEGKKQHNSAKVSRIVCFHVSGFFFYSIEFISSIEPQFILQLIEYKNKG